MYNTDLPTRAQLPSSAALMRSTIIAAVTAAALLVTVVLPAEYAIDPTGFGRMVGLAQKGEIKQQLALEAAADAAAAATPAPSAQPAPEANSGAILRALRAVDGRLASLEVKVTGLAQRPLPEASGADPVNTEPAARSAAAEPPPVVEAPPVPEALPEMSEPDTVAAVTPAVEPEAPADPEPPAAAAWRDAIAIKLAPGEGAEVKLVVKKGDLIRYAWVVEGGVVNYDLHGKPSQGAVEESSIKKDRGVDADEAELNAPYTGRVGWFWRNRGNKPVTVTLRTGGEYGELKRVQ
jgi:hypothetical protein